MTQVYLSGHDESGPFGAACDCSGTGDAVTRAFDIDLRESILFSSLSASFFSTGAAAVGVEGVALAKSKAVPGVFGVLAAEPKDAKAPDPRPKALEPPAVGDDTVVALKGGLKGLFLLEDMLPKRFGVSRVGWSLLSCRSDLSMERDSLLVLRSD